MKKIILALTLVASVFGCSDDTESIKFLEKYDNTVWQLIDNSDYEKYNYLRIISNPNKIADRWYLSDSNNCYFKHFYGDGFDIAIGSNTEDYLELEQRNAIDMNQDLISLKIRNDTLIQAGYTGNAHGYYNWTHLWVRSKVNVKDLKSCD